jgi:hypothetical protein
MKRIILIIFIFLLGCTTQPIVEDATPDAVTEASPRIPLEELYMHNVSEDCWVAYDGRVYISTNITETHEYCGTAVEFSDAVRSNKIIIDNYGKYIGFLK